ncbi:MAG TPA: transglutaminase-like domain-containing protein, partial [Acidobacteriota bacterium]|nr:transglutaminase-like domain-containing protein [Acidobacteriota bacterium]
MMDNRVVGGMGSFLTGVVLLLTAGCGTGKPGWDPLAGVVFRVTPDPGIASSVREVEKIDSPLKMKAGGLSGVMGGMHLKAFRGGTYDLRIPVPQLADGQIPIFYSLSSEPEDAIVECRLQKAGSGSSAVNLRIKAGKGEEIFVNWTGAVLISESFTDGAVEQGDPYVQASACVQSGDPKIKGIAEKLWKGSGGAEGYAAGIQKFIMGMKQAKQPSSLDALGILSSGCNTICTSNANLACALMRAKSIPCRSVAVVPTIPRRFEMHRVAEYHDGNRWVSFDPSCVNMDIPLKPWQNIVMARTSIGEEDASMKPRAGAMAGCPVGQEAEFARLGLNLFGND